MATRLMFRTIADTWQVTDKLDSDELRDMLDEAHKAGTLVHLALRPADGGDTHTVTVNPRELGWWSVFEGPEYRARLAL